MQNVGPGGSWELAELGGGGGGGGSGLAPHLGGLAEGRAEGRKGAKDEGRLCLARPGAGAFRRTGGRAEAGDADAWVGAPARGLDLAPGAGVGGAPAVGLGAG